LDPRQGAAAQPGAEAGRRDLCSAVAAGGDGFSRHSGRDLHRSGNHALPPQLRPSLLQQGHCHHQPAVIHLPYENNPANGPIYPTYIPKTDSDGNDIAGVRLVDVTVPLATYTGWALRSGPQANDGCESSGQYIAFTATQAQRLAAGDPRLSVEERYPTFNDYHHKIRHALDHMVAERLLLCEDSTAEEARLIAVGLAAGVPAPVAAVTAETLAHCREEQ
jgi:hypothetical protein